MSLYARMRQSGVDHTKVPPSLQSTARVDERHVYLLVKVGLKEGVLRKP